MTSKKQPPKPTSPPARTPDADALRQPIEVVTEAVVNALGQLRGAQTKDVAKVVSNVQTEVQSLVTSIEQKASDPQTRKAAAQEIEKLIDVFTRTGAAIGGALAHYKEPLTKALQGVDMKKASDALRMLADWMQNPSPEREAEVKKAVADLQGKMGAMVGYNEKREEEQRREQIKADVKASLDEIFRGKKT